MWTNSATWQVAFLFLFPIFAVCSCYFFCANLQSALGFVSFSYFCYVHLFLYSSTMPRKTRANRVPSTPSVSPSMVQLFRNERSREAYEKLNSKHKIWAECSVILDEVDPAIRS